MVGADRTRFRPSRLRYGYGVHWAGLGDAADLMPASGAATDPAVVRIRLAGATPAPPPVPIDDRYGTWTSADGRLVAIDRRARTATFHGPPPTPDLLAHPCLAPVATAFNRWAGRESFHAGAFVAGGRAWILLGGRTAGKSSLLAALAARGVPVLTDDVVMVDDAGVYAGPRCVDLRQAVPGLALRTRPVRDGTRLRATLPAIADPCPLGGWIFLNWTDPLEPARETVAPGAAPAPRLTPIGASQLLGRLAARRTWPGLSSDPAVLLALAARPAWDLVRSWDWTALEPTCQLLESVALVTASTHSGGQS